MFGFFKRHKIKEPLTYEKRKWIEHNMHWFYYEFKKPSLEERKQFVPLESEFPIDFNGTKECAQKTLHYVANSMQINPDELKLNIFYPNVKELGFGTTRIFLESDPQNNEAAGQYFEKDESGKYTIALNAELLKIPEQLISTIAHELAHVKLLGENRIEENDEYLTDLCTVFFGYGIFNANTSFSFFKEFDKWGTNNTGYLLPQEWAYALALFAFIRHEDQPEWKKFLNKTLQDEFEQSLSYMLNNENDIFREDENKL